MTRSKLCHKKFPRPFPSAYCWSRFSAGNYRAFMRFGTYRIALKYRRNLGLLIFELKSLIVLHEYPLGMQ